MKIALLALALLLLLSASPSRAAFYQWVDAQGVTHFTDDPDKIPKRYQKRARQLELSEEPARSRVSPDRPEPSPQTAAPKPAPGVEGRSQGWWRARFSALRDELKTLQDGIPAKQAKLAELRRKRVLYMRAQDREAVNRMQDEVAADQTRVTELQNQIDALERDAVEASIPAEWRQ